MLRTCRTARAAARGGRVPQEDRAEDRTAVQRELASVSGGTDAVYMAQEQANKMIANAGGSKTFAAAPVRLARPLPPPRVATNRLAVRAPQTREGAHMIRVSDPPRGDRVVSVEIFHILSTHPPLLFSSPLLSRPLVVSLTHSFVSGVFTARVREAGVRATGPGARHRLHPSVRLSPDAQVRP
jgi:hypothetical protein